MHSDVLAAPIIRASVFLPFGSHRQISPLGIFNQAFALIFTSELFNSRAVSGDRLNLLSILAILWAVLLAVSQLIDIIKLLGLAINGLIHTDGHE